MCQTRNEKLFVRTQKIENPNEKCLKNQNNKHSLDREDGDIMTVQLVGSEIILNHWTLF